MPEGRPLSHGQNGTVDFLSGSPAAFWGKRLVTEWVFHVCVIACVAAVTNQSRASRIKHSLILSQFHALAAQVRVAQLCPLLRVSPGWNQDARRAVFLSGGSETELTSKLTRTVGLFQFLAGVKTESHFLADGELVLALRSCLHSFSGFPCALLSSSSSQSSPFHASNLS